MQPNAKRPINFASRDSAINKSWKPGDIEKVK